MLRIQNIHKSYNGNPVLAGLNLEIASGERFILLGPSGCGKTTLLRMIAGFESPDSGEIFIAGENVSALPVEKRPVGFIFQRHALFPHLNIFDNVAVGPRVRGRPEKETTEQIHSLLKKVGMEKRKNSFPHELSGGESQRVALARAIINRPKLLLLDEPLSALDESLRQNMRDELIEFQENFNITFLFVTHDREEAMTLAHRMSVLHEGRSLQEGEPDELYARPKHAKVARFLGEVNSFEGKVTADDGTRFTFTSNSGDILHGKSNASFKPGDICVCYLRPESLFFISDPSPEHKNILKGTLKRRALLGRNVRFHISLDSGPSLELVQTYRPAGASPEEGTPVLLGFGEDALHLFEKGDS